MAGCSATVLVIVKWKCLYGRALLFCMCVVHGLCVWVDVLCKLDVRAEVWP